MRRATFIAATEGLRIARQNGVEASGYQALVIAHKLIFERHLPKSYRVPEVPLSLEAAENFKKLGSFVELAAGLELPVDQQG